ncbi:hypothetical protein NLG97_g7113 [Lecanicillium saksenae]|uniref:Uncharacterized protein n=1 Tax=Lecanicillium saksenae TaxID=468837 RepID=A0ACC1QQY0_9HYPO|nr:hypothetical protein NLG97_g7113 [Lecanicillium saksenae]
MEPRKIPLFGGCHCGATRYIIFLTLPAPHNESNPFKPGEQKIYRCNCTICQKASIFSVRPADPTDDFLLLSPLDPYTSLGDYLTDDKEIHFFFCKTCGVRCFSTNATGELVDVDTAALGLPEGKNAPARAWRAVRGSGHPEYGTFVNVHGNTIDPDHTEFDMRELTETKRVQYFENYSEPREGPSGRWDRPHVHGCY